MSPIVPDDVQHKAKLAKGRAYYHKNAEAIKTKNKARYNARRKALQDARRIALNRVRYEAMIEAEKVGNKARIKARNEIFDRLIIEVRNQFAALAENEAEAVADTVLHSRP